MSRRIRSFLLVSLLVSHSVFPLHVFAQSASSDVQDQINEIQEQVRLKEQSVKSLDAAIAQYQTTLAQQTKAANTLKNQLALLETVLQQQAVKVQRAQAKISLLDTQIQANNELLQKAEARLQVDRALLEEAITTLDNADRESSFLAFFERSSLSSILSEREDVQTIQRSLAQVTQQVHASKNTYEQTKRNLEDTRVQAVAEQKTLQKAQDQLQQDREAKVSLIAETKNKESEYQRVLGELRSQQQREAEAISALQERLKEKLNNSDETLARGDFLLQWPVTPKRGISAQFHDQTYPFRQLFEHPGIDLPTPVGTPVHAAAGGYVAWNRTGTQYGNYVMIIHPNGLASVYAHLSGFVAKPDTYVSRGDVIGLSGGRPGDQGAGLSTGAHLHFEVRQNGIPVNPENFLPEL